MKSRPLAILTVATLLQAGVAVAQDKAALEQRLTSVGTLIERSSAARQIEASRDPRALEGRNEARALHRKASDALQAGDVAGAAKLLDQATRQLMTAARAAAPEEITAEKRRTDFNNRYESVKTLLAAQQRIAREKGSGADAAQAAKQIETLMAEATTQANAGQIDAARATIDRAYLLAKASISTMRRGDTLVRSLNFATKREEYDYEIDRNDTHRMLVNVLLEERRASNPALDRSVRNFLDEAARLRGEAEQQAQKGGFDAAIKTLEDSTRELVRAIRGAGVYIPG
jgi:ribosomal protein S20